MDHLPAGPPLHHPRDRLGTKIARLLMQPGEARDRLTRDVFVPQSETDPVGVLNHALNAHIEAESTEGKLRRAQRDGKLKALNARGRLEEALAAGLISQIEFDVVVRARRLKREVIMVDDFDTMLDRHDTELSQREPV
nr:acyl-CoA dehydrogenase domain-containing protein [Chitinimonas koreensis]